MNQTSLCPLFRQTHTSGSKYCFYFGEMTLNTICLCCSCVSFISEITSLFRLPTAFVNKTNAVFAIIVLIFFTERVTRGINLGRSAEEVKKLQSWKDMLQYCSILPTGLSTPPHALHKMYGLSDKNVWIKT